MVCFRKELHSLHRMAVDFVFLDREGEHSAECGAMAVDGGRGIVTAREHHSTLMPDIFRRQAIWE